MVDGQDNTRGRGPDRGGGHRTRPVPRTVFAIFLGLMLIATACETTIEGSDGTRTMLDTTVQIRYAESPDRAGSNDLDEARVDGPVHVFLAYLGSEVEAVEWTLDGESVNHDAEPPFDLAGSDGSLALPWDTSELLEGRHTVTAHVSFAAGAVLEVEATFVAAAGADAGEVDIAEGATDLLSADQQSFEQGIEGWRDQGNAVIEASDADAKDGSRSLLATVSRDGVWTDDNRTSRIGTTAIPATAQTAYTGQAHTLLREGDSRARCELRFYQASKILETLDGPFTDAGAEGWTPVACTAKSPTGTTHVGLRVLVDEADWGEEFLVDDAHLWVASSAASSASAPPPSTPPVTEAPGPASVIPAPAIVPPAPAPPTRSPSAEGAGWEQAVASKNMETIRSWYNANTGFEGYFDPELGRYLTEADLEPMNGMAIHEDNVVIEKKYITGPIQIFGDNVTIRASIIDVRGYGYGVQATTASGKAAGQNWLVDHVTFRNSRYESSRSHTDRANRAIYSSSPGTARFNKTLDGYHSGYRSESSRNQLWEYNYVDHIVTSPESHNTSFGMRSNAGGSGVSDVTVHRNLLLDGTSSALSFYTRSSALHKNVLFSENIFDIYHADQRHVNYCAQRGSSGGYAKENVRWIGNIFGQTQASTCGTSGPKTGDGGTEFSGNRYLDGTPV